MVKINEIRDSINEDKIGDAAFELGQIFLNQRDHKNADACNLIRDAWRSVTVASPLTATDEEIMYVEKARVELANFYKWDSKKSAGAELDDLIEAAEKAGESGIKPNAMELSSEAEKWYAISERLKEIKSGWSVYAGSPLTPQETLKLAKEEIEDTNLHFKAYRINHFISYYERIDGADPSSEKDVIEKLTNEIDALQGVIDKSKKPGSQISDVVSFDALRIKNFFKELRKKLKNSSNQSDETRNSKVKKSDSPVTGVSSAIGSEVIIPVVKRGGIDLTDRMLKIKLERVGSFASSSLALPEIADVEALDLDKEYERIQAMANVSIRPSDTRILEFAAACYYRGEFDQRLAQVSSCIKSAHLADEISGRDSSEALRLATMLPDALYGG